MDANEQPCMCELCQPNWHFVDGFFEPQAAVQPEAEAIDKELAQRESELVFATG